MSDETRQREEFHRKLQNCEVIVEGIDDAIAQLRKSREPLKRHLAFLIDSVVPESELVKKEQRVADFCAVIAILDRMLAVTP